MTILNEAVLVYVKSRILLLSSLLIIMARLIEYLPGNLIRVDLKLNLTLEFDAFTLGYNRSTA